MGVPTPERYERPALAFPSERQDGSRGGLVRHLCTAKNGLSDRQGILVNVQMSAVAAGGLSIARDAPPDDGSSARAFLHAAYDELRRMAAVIMQRERGDHTLQATALVHELFVRLAGQHSAGWRNYGDFLRVASHAMRRVLIDYARTASAEKRGAGGRRMPLDETLLAFQRRGIDLLEFDSCLERLSQIDARKATVVEMRFLGGLSLEETADALDVPLRTVEREWALARTWLRTELSAA